MIFRIIACSGVLHLYCKQHTTITWLHDAAALEFNLLDIRKKLH